MKAAVLLLFTACAGEHALSGIPDVAQPNSWSCGVGAVQAVLARHGDWPYADDLALELGTTKEDGTHPARMVAALRARGLDATLREGMTSDDLRRAVDAGDAVIIDFQAWSETPAMNYDTDWEDGHYGVVVGYRAGAFLIEDPSLLGSLGWLAPAELERRWHDYETEAGRRREYVHAGILVKGQGKKRPPAVHID